MMDLGGAAQMLLFEEAVTSLCPRQALWVHQGGCCAGCGIPIPPTARASRSLNGQMISGLVCGTCSRKRVVLPGGGPVNTVGPLLRLRLRQGPVSAFPKTVTNADVDSLCAGQFDQFLRPTHALWVYQDGWCALSDPKAPHTTVRPVLDHDHRTDLVRGMLCPSHNSQEGKGGRHADIGRLRAYQRRPPAQDCVATRGLTYRYLTTWAR